MVLRIYDHQRLQTDTPWTVRERIGMQLWEYCWTLLCSWTPKPANRWRLFILTLFGARIEGRPFVHQRARIQVPWRLCLRDGATLGDRANAYSLGEIELCENATVAQEAYLCTGTHLFDRPSMNLATGKITIGPNAFVGARAFIMPGVTIGAGAIVGACSVLTSDVGPGDIVAGNPARFVRRRNF
jgi:putative colanic acid biosynthesis acetyltransferase WcaF